MSDVRVVDLPDSVFRVGRGDDPLRFSTIRPDDAVLGAGNRYDIPGGAVLYGASTIRACFGETAARFRPTPKMRELLAEEKDFMLCGGIPRDWRSRRTIVEFTGAAAAPMVDVDAPETLAHLSIALSPTLVGLGYADNLDLSTLRSQDRKLSRAISLWVYSQTDEQGRLLYSGIRYTSRIDDSWECYAIFDGTDVYETSRRPVERHDVDLQAVATMWDLTVH